MKDFRYKVVPFMGKIKGGSWSKDNARTVSKQLEEQIQTHCDSGWEYVGMERVQIEVSPGCFGILTGKKEAYIDFDQIVFRRELD